MIPYGRQDIQEEDIAAVVDVLRSEWLTQGPQVELFEADFKAYVGSEHCIAFNSATSALHVACMALGLSHGDVLWTSPITFVASANCALYCGASIDFVDVDPSTYNMCADALEEKLRQAKKENCLPKVVVPVHFAGQSCDMKRIKTMSEEYGFYIIEDAAHAVGARYCGEPVGNCKYSDITIFSLHPVKIITTAEGGIAFTNDQQLDEKMRLYRSHGVSRSDSNSLEYGGWYYEQTCLGYNYRIPDLLCALGRSQLLRLDEYVAQRHERVKRYQELFSNRPSDVKLPFQSEDTYSSFHLYPIQVESSIRRCVYDELRAKGVGVNVHYIPVHTQPYYREKGFNIGDFPNAEEYYSRAISLPLFPQLTNEQQEYIVSTLFEALQ